MIIDLRSRLESQAGKVIRLRDGLIAISRDGDLELLTGILDTADEGSIAIKRNLAMIAADEQDLNCGTRNLSVNVENKVVTRLLCRITAESSITGDILQRTANRANACSYP